MHIQEEQLNEMHQYLSQLPDLVLGGLSKVELIPNLGQVSLPYTCTLNLSGPIFRPGSVNLPACC